MPIASIASPGLDLNGTRLTVISDGRGGVEFSICSSSLPERFAQFEAEMEACFERLTQALLHWSSPRTEDEELINEIARESLIMFYYWVNFAPLTRGTSATGYAGLLSFILITGNDFKDSLPPRVQLDWEALFSTSPDAFVAKTLPMITNRGPTLVPLEWIELPVLEDEHGGNKYDLENVFKTLRHVLYTMSYNLPIIQETNAVV